VAPGPLDDVKREVAAHWNRRAAHFDEDFGHSIRTPAERAAWDRILDLVLAGIGINPSISRSVTAVPGRDERSGGSEGHVGGPQVLDVGAGTGFLSFELAARGHRVVGVDFAPAMIAEARRKAAATGVSIRFEEADAERLPFPSRSFDLVMSRHLLWTLPHPEAAIDEWIRVLRPAGRLVIVDSQCNAGALAAGENARASQEYAAIGDRLPFLGGRPREEIETLLRVRGLEDVRSDPLLDLVAAQAQRMIEEGREPVTRRRYVVWGDVARSKAPVA
jgi:SAM-dependent methyltransferase